MFKWPYTSSNFKLNKLLDFKQCNMVATNAFNMVDVVAIKYEESLILRFVS